MRFDEAFPDYDDFFDELSSPRTYVKGKGTSLSNPYLEDMLEGLGIPERQYRAWMRGDGTITTEKEERLLWLQNHVQALTQKMRESTSLDKRKNLRKLMHYNIDEGTPEDNTQPLWYHYTGSVWTF